MLDKREVLLDDLMVTESKRLLIGVSDRRRVHAGGCCRVTRLSSAMNSRLHRNELFSSVLTVFKPNRIKGREVISASFVIL